MGRSRAAETIAARLAVVEAELTDDVSVIEELKLVQVRLDLWIARGRLSLTVDMTAL